MKSREKWNRMRFGFFIALHVFLCVNVLGWGMAYMAQWSAAGYVEDFYVDGEDIAPIVNMGVLAFNGVLAVFIGLLGILYMTVASGLSMTLFQCFGLKDTDQVEDSELWGSLAVILGGAAVCMLLGLLGMGGKAPGLLGAMFVPVLLFEFFPYWFILRRTNRRGKASVLQQESVREDARHV